MTARIDKIVISELAATDPPKIPDVTLAAGEGFDST